MNSLYTMTQTGLPLPAVGVEAFWRAADAWAAVLGPADRNVRLDGEVATAFLPAGVIAWTNTVTTAPLPGNHLWEQGSVTELRTGVDPNGAAPDWRTIVDLAKTADFTPDQWFAMWLHELGHPLAWNGLGPESQDRTLWDTLVRETDHGPVFVGELAMGAFGGPVPLQPDMLHVAVAGTLMFPTMALHPAIGAIELGVLGDTGVPLAAAVHVAAAQDPALPVAAPAQAEHAVWLA